MVLKEGEGILLVRLGAVGDVVRTLPCLAVLRESAPGARLAWAVESPSAALLPGLPWLDEVFVFPRRNLHWDRLLSRPSKGFRAVRSFLAALRGFRPAAAIDFQGTAKSSMIARLSGAPLRLGFDWSGAREGSFLLSNVRIRPTSPHLNRIHKNLELVRPLAVPGGPLKFPFRQEEISEKLRRFLGPLEGRLRISIHPGTSRRQNHKQWPAENFSRVIASLAAKGFAPILTWGPGEEDLIRTIQEQSGNSGVPTPPLDLQEMRHVIARSHLFIGGDTGPMHLAWSQGVPVVALFGATDPRINGPLGEGHRILAPAWDGTRPAPVRGDRSTILQILPEDVVRETLDLLASRGNSVASSLPS
jgi:lipopolysaccharide heptosyltransferase I